MTAIFLSYRRSDSAGHVQNLRHRLLEWYDEDQVFFDWASIDAGDSFPDAIATALDEAKVILVLVGPDWSAELLRRTSRATLDYVREEACRAGQRLKAGDGIRVIPVLLADGKLPDLPSLPDDLRRDLAPVFDRNAHVFSFANERDWEHQFTRLRELIAKVPGIPVQRYRDRSGRPTPWHCLNLTLSRHFMDPQQQVQALRDQLLAGTGPSALIGAAQTPSGVESALPALYAVSALSGMGGLGKTQLALAYSQTFKDHYAGVWWFRAEQSATLQEDALAACAAAGTAPVDRQLPTEALKNWLRGRASPWLLVYDNAEDPSALRELLPDPGAHHVVITSRRPDWASLATPLALSVWSDERGAQYLRERLGADQAPEAESKQLSHKLGGLPLAVEQAASYMEARGRSVQAYLELWSKHSRELLQRKQGHSDYDRAVATTLGLAFERLSPAARQLLRLLAFAAPDPVPERLFREGAALPEPALPDPLHTAAARPLEWDDAVEELRRYALASVVQLPSLDRAWQAGTTSHGTSEPALLLHRLTQQVVREFHADGVTDSHDWYDLLKASMPESADDPRHWPKLQALVPHALAAVEALQRDKAAETPPAIETLERVGTLINVSSDFLRDGAALLTDAKQMEEALLELQQADLGPDHPDTLTTMSNLAQTLYAQGELAEARALQQQVLDASQRLLGPDHPHTLRAMGNLAVTLQSQGELAEARVLQQQGLDACQRLLGPDHPDTLVWMGNLAQTLYDQGELAEARALQQQVLDASQRLLGPDHPHTLRAMGNLAGTLQSQGELAEARVLQQQGLDACQRLLGPDHPDTLVWMGNLAQTLYDQGELAEARALQQQVLDASQRLLGPDHPHTLRAMGNLAGTLQSHGELAEARVLQQQGLDSSQRLLGPDHPHTLTAMNNLAQTLYAQGELAEARDLQQQVLDAIQRLLGPDHLHTLKAMGNLAVTLQSQGELAEARVLQQQVLDASQRLLGPNHPDTLTAMNNLAQTLYAQGELAEARDLQQQVLDAIQRLLGPDHLHTLKAMGNLAVTLQSQGELAEARVLQQQVLDASQRLLGPNHPDTLRAMGNLATTLRALGELAEARDLQQQVLDASQRLLGPDHPHTLTAMGNLATTLRALGDERGAAELEFQRSRPTAPKEDGKPGGFHDSESATGQVQVSAYRPSRNSPCPCGSGLRFKACHGRLT